MSETRSTLNATQYLDETDCNITNEYNNFIDGHDERDKFSTLVAQARKTKSVLAAKQVKLDQITSQHQRELTYCKESADSARDKLGEQSRKLRRCQGENENL